MSGVGASEALFRLWHELDSCDACRDEAYALPTVATPGRPHVAPRESCVLFVGEAPPRDGGFWTPGNGDGLRERLLPLLPGWADELDWDSIDGLNWFVDSGYFFVQAMKWPLKQSYSLQDQASARALEHALASHLEAELALIDPRCIVALGGAAWDACTALSERHGLRLVEPLRVDKGRTRHHVFMPAKGRSLPLHVTRLPGKQNHRFKWSPVIRHDIEVFLSCGSHTIACELTQRLAPPHHRARTAASQTAEGIG